MPNRAAFALVATLVLAACSAETAVAPTTPRAPSTGALVARGVTASHPMSGRCDLTVLATDAYPSPPVFRQVATGTCNLTHLGQVAVHFVQVVNFATRTQSSLELTYTAANGDVLRAASAGTSAPIPTGVSFSATIRFLGGTGRFVNATGEASAWGTADLGKGTSQYTVEGWIAYDAADRGRL